MTWVKPDEAMPFENFPEEHQAGILAAVAAPRPPARWIDLGFAQIESRAWYEWHWARGIFSQRTKLLPSLRAMIIDRDGYVCGICGGAVEPADVHIDHIFPVALGGSDEPGNLRVSHSRCNMTKGAKV